MSSPTTLVVAVGASPLEVAELYEEMFGGSLGNAHTYETIVMRGARLGAVALRARQQIQKFRKICVVLGASRLTLEEVHAAFSPDDRMTILVLETKQRQRERAQRQALLDQAAIQG